MNKEEEIKAQKIIDAIQRGEIDADLSVKTFIKQADEYLLHNGEKPDFYDAFIKITSRDLKTTVNGCVKSRNQAKHRDDLTKYKEGYFYEIVQNANDIVWKSDQIKNPKMTVAVAKKENGVYKVTCTYPDEGFCLLNIYGFCTKGNSDKSAEKGQEGMYGIGIKSLLCFADELEIDSNISIQIHASADGKILDEVQITEPKKERQKKQTSLSFTFTCHGDSQNLKHAGFNTRKLADLIDEVYKENDRNFDRFFFNGKDDEMVFDTRSLFFTELRGENRKYENSIKCLELKKEGQDGAVLNIKATETTVCMDDVKIAEIKGHFKYIIFHYTDQQISVAFEYNQKQQEVEDRLYATYFIGTYDPQRSLLGKKTGCLVNTTAINSSRSGLEREKEQDPEILKSIIEKGKKSAETLCKILAKDEVCLDILCQLLWIFREERGQIFDDQLVECIQDSISDWCFGDGCRYILKEEDEIIDKEIRKNRPISSDQNNLKALFRIYKRYLHPENNSDIVLSDSEGYEKLTSGIKNLCEVIFDQSEEKKEIWITQELGKLPFLTGVKELIERRIGGSGFAEIQKYLETLEKEDRIFMKQLIARYKVSNDFDLMGNYTDDIIRDWLFGGMSSDSDYEKKAEEFEYAYGELKQLIQPFIGTIQYKISAYRAVYWERVKNEYSKAKNLQLSDDYMLQLLEWIAYKKIYVGVIKTKEKYQDDLLFIHNLPIHFKLTSNEKKSCKEEGSFKYIYLDQIFEKYMSSFDKFKIARNYVDKYKTLITEKNGVNGYYGGKDEDFTRIPIRDCTVQEMKLSELKDVFKWLAEYEHVDAIGRITIKQIDFEEQKSDVSSLIDFVKLLIEKEDVFIKINVIPAENNKKKFIGYATNLNDKSGLRVHLSADGKFKEMGAVPEEGKKYLLIYTTYDNEREVLSKVFKDLSYKEEICSYIENFIKTGNIKTMKIDMYHKFLMRRRQNVKFLFEDLDLEDFDLEEEFNLQQTMDLLTGEMSYNSHCPICRLIPTLDLEEANIHRLENKNFLVAMLKAKHNQSEKYVKILCCKSCFKEYKDSLTEAVVEDVDNAKYKKLILKNTISTIEMSRDMENEVLISPLNWEIIRRFNEE